MMRSFVAKGLFLNLVHEVIAKYRVGGDTYFSRSHRGDQPCPEGTTYCARRGSAIGQCCSPFEGSVAGCDNEGQCEFTEDLTYVYHDVDQPCGGLWLHGLEADEHQCKAGLECRKENAGDQCTWLEEDCTCQYVFVSMPEVDEDGLALDPETSCREYDQSDRCSASIHQCKWVHNECVDLKIGECSQIEFEPLCNSNNRCVWKKNLEGCESRFECPDIQNPTTCGDKKTCKWTRARQCEYKLCHEITRGNICRSSSLGCQWTGGLCIAPHKKEGEACDAPNRVRPNPFSRQCASPFCCRKSDMGPGCKPGEDDCWCQPQAGSGQGEMCSPECGCGQGYQCLGSDMGPPCYMLRMQDPQATCYCQRQESRLLQETHDDLLA